MAQRGKDVVSIGGLREEEGAAAGKGGAEQEARREAKGESIEPGAGSGESGGGLEAGRPSYLC